MNWYKLSQLYTDIVKEEYNDPELFSAEQYFSIGQSEETQDQSFCWIYLDEHLYVRKGHTTHNLFLSSMGRNHALIHYIYRGEPFTSGL